MIDVLAHGIGGRLDLPVPTWLAIYGAGAAVVFSFAALGLLWPAARLRGDRAGRPLPRPLEAFLDSPVTRGVLRAVALVVSAVVVLAAFTVGDDVNIAPWALYVVLWVGLVPLSLLFGPVWRVVNPLRTIHAGLARLTATDPADGIRDYPDRFGYWPAAAALAVFAWVELVHPEPATPGLVGGFLVVYALVNLVGANVFGSVWFERADGFEVYSTLIGRLAPIGRRADGRLVLRNPLNGLAAESARPGLVAVVVLLLGSTAYDGVTRQKWWRDFIREYGGWSGVPLTTAVLVACVAFVALTYLAAARAAARPAAADRRTMPGVFAHSLVPIAIGYAIAHYFTLLLLDGQTALILASDPLDRGWDLFGTARWALNLELFSTRTIALVQIGAIVGGHVLGVVAAHDRAVALFRGPAGVRSQYPLLAVMVAYTLGGVALLLGA